MDLDYPTKERAFRDTGRAFLNANPGQGLQHKVLNQERLPPDDIVRSDKIVAKLPAPHYFKRPTMIELTLDDTGHHIARFARQPEFNRAA